ncbi:MAG: hypothetical protein JL50_12645 [Peptococcaceae bacterium BICA1-7]|nr:MAG: hypothetical protein JL50_12645 [Peptococcaceae bacterium BICA1-7]
MTLIELVIALAIFSVVLAASYTFYFYVYRSITIASQQSELQFNVRMASDRIRDIVHFANEMEVLQYSEEAAGQDEAIYADSSALIHHKSGAAANLLGYNYGNIAFQISFNKKDDVFLWYNVRGTKGGQTFEISREIQILSIPEDEEIIKSFGDPSTTGEAIVFHFPPAP